MNTKFTLNPAPRLLQRLLVLTIISLMSLSTLRAQVTSTLTPLSPIPILINTSELPQSKAWSHAGKKWCVLGTAAGTVIMRLDGTTWTNVFTLASGNFVKADVKTVGDVAHILVYKGSTSVLYSVEYVPATANYKLWTVRKTRVDFTLETANQTATIDIDGTGRMWLASDGSKDVNVRWSDAPYAVWSAPIKLETNTSTTDICAVVALPGKIGVFWSNKITKRFAFRTHENGDDPSVWSADEAPASQSALNIGSGFAESQFNLKVSAAGRLYASIKTGYNSPSNTQLALLVRQPSGVWDDAYTVTTGSGQRPIVVINEALDVLKVVYTSNDVVSYKQSPIYPISFGDETTLINEPYDNVTSAKNYSNTSTVILASNAFAAAGVLIEDAFQGTDQTPPAVESITRYAPAVQNTNALAVTYRVIFSEKVTGVTADDFSLTTVSGSVAGALATNAVTEVGTAGTTYDVEATINSGAGTLRLDLKSSGTGIADEAGNNITAGYTSGQSYILTEPAPTLTSVAIVSNNDNPAAAKSGDIVTLSFTASTAVDLPVVTIAGHFATVVPQGGNSFTATRTLAAGDDEGEVTFLVTFNTTGGTGGLPVNQTTNDSKVVFDKTIPLIQSIDRHEPLSQSTTAVTVTYRAVFSEKVSGVNAADFTVTNVNGSVTGTLGSSAVTPAGSTGTTYDIDVISISGTGTFRLNLNANGTGIVDAAGNALNDGFISGQTYIKSPPPPPTGEFASVTPLTPIVTTVDTKDKPQSKVWKYNNKWWTVLSVTGGTKIFRLDGTAWTPVLTLTTTSGKNDVRVVGDVVHVLMFKGEENVSLLYSIEHVPANNTYKLWTVRPTKTNLSFPLGAETANLAMDGTGRLWVTSTGTTEAYVWYADYPYSAWSQRITLATNIKDDDISVITALPNENKIAVLWSNQITKRYGFRTHADGDDPNVWSTEESPASQSAMDNIGAGMSDDHLNAKVGSDGTYYLATKTSYNKNGYAKVTLLIRRPNGVWDNLHTVTMNPDGTQPAIILNETKHVLKIVYCSKENGGDILYKESSMDNISFGPAKILISNPLTLYDYVSTASDNYTSDILLLATNLSTSPKQVVGVLASDDENFAYSAVLDSASTLASTVDDLAESRPGTLRLAQNTVIYPNPFSTFATVNFTLSESAQYSVLLYNNTGSLVSVIKQGYGAGGVPNTVRIDKAGLASGIYLLRIQTKHGSQTFKLLKK